MGHHLSHKAKRRRQQLPITPLSLWERWRHDFDLLLSSSDDVASSYLRSVWVSKLRDPSVTSDETRASAAIKKWLAVEERNARTNQRLYLDCAQFTWATSDEIFGTASRFIRETIGDAPPVDLLSFGEFTDGASTSIKRGVGNVGRKFESGTHVTEAAWGWILPIIVESPTWLLTWAGKMPTLVPGNHLFTVPKSSEIDRCAAKEPDLNMFAQKACGNFIRRRLLKKHINLNDQTINQRLARLGSIDGSLATIDLSSASDSLTTQLVCRLLPVDWFHLLSCLRSPQTLIPSQGNEASFWHENQMFSSMGNAFTFELETLIFWALARACAYHTGIKGRISVYGDDIIVPAKLARPLVHTLGFCGFKANKSKSFWTGPFRESCGKHYHLGRDITPFYVKEIPTTVDRWIHLANRLRGWLERSAIVEVLDPDFYQSWLGAARNVPRPLWGGYDTERIDVLVAPGIRPLATLRRKSMPDWKISGQEPDEDGFISRSFKGGKVVSEMYAGLYLHWLSQGNLGRSGEVSNLAFTGELELSRQPMQSWLAFWTSVSRFPQEWGSEL